MTFPARFLRTLIAAALLTTAAHAADFDRTLQVTQPADLYVSTSFRPYPRDPGSDDQIHVHAHVYAGWNSGATSRHVSPALTRIRLSRSLATKSTSEMFLPRIATSTTTLLSTTRLLLPSPSLSNLRSGSGDIESANLGRFLRPRRAPVHPRSRRRVPRRAPVRIRRHRHGTVRGR